jgi:hypothetical protein
MPKTYPPEFFENKQEQSRISLLLQRLVAGAYEEDVFSKSHKSQLTSLVPDSDKLTELREDDDSCQCLMCGDVHRRR